ncbi:aspartyl protease apcb1 [Quercus suber]|uniref:Aspartic proteinase Asp1 n=1 Tax=Quercus suber TaxID=58331 RepID=A0AAW0L720_QUESU
MKVGMLGLLRVVVLVLVLRVSSSSSSSSSSSYFGQKNRRSSILPVPVPEQATTSSLKLNRVGSSIVFPLHGNVYPIGFYNVTLNIGQPSKPYFLDPDTGSDLTWLQCDAPCVRCTETPHPLYKPSNSLVPCNDPLCKSLHPPEHRCETPEQCDYEIQYADGGSSMGVLVKDAFSFNFTNGEQLKPPLALGCGYDQIPGPYPHPFDELQRMGNVCLGILDGKGTGLNIIGDISMQDKMVIYNNEKQLIGWAPANCDRLPKSKTSSICCGYDQIPGPYPHPFDGVLGLGKGKSSIVSQLSKQGLVQNVVGHCISVRGGGYLFFGDGLYDSSRVLWTSMSRDHREHYSPGFAELIFGGKTTGIKNLLTVFDSGSSYTYLNSPAYQALVSWVKKELTGRSLREASDDKTLPLCWKGRRPFKSVNDVRKYFKPIALSFANGGRAKTQFELPPEAYLIISRMGNVCLGILDGKGTGLNIIGDISMQDKMVIYNNEKQLIGWAPANCDRLPKSKTSSIW